MSKKPLIIYWSPYTLPNGKENAFADKEPTFGWNMLYKDPTNLFSEMVKKRNPKSTTTSFFVCPSVANRLKNTFVFRNSLETTITFDNTDEDNPKVDTTGLGVHVRRPSALVDGISIVLSLKYIFFAEEPLEAVVSPPYMHRPTYWDTMTYTPGNFDISKWFRPIAYEVQTFSSKGEFTVEEDDPIFYVEAITDRPIVFKRFVLTETLFNYSEACVQSPNWYGRNLPLVARYKRFTESKMNELVLKEIKHNLLEESSPVIQFTSEEE